VISRRWSILLGVSVLWIPLAFLGDGVTVLLLPLRVATDATTLGLVSALGLALGALLQPAIGWLSDAARDHVDRRFVTAAGTVPALAGLWLLAGSSGLVAAVAGYLLVQAAAAAMQAGQQTLIPEHVDPAAQGRAAGMKASFDVGGSFLAFALLGALLVNGGVPAAAVLIAAVAVVATVAMLATVPPTRGARRPSARRPRTLPRALPGLVLARFLFLFGTYAVGRFIVLLVADRLAVAPDDAVDEAAVWLAVLSLVTAIAAVPGGWLADRLDRRDLVAGSGLVAAAGILLLIPAAGMAGLIAGGVLMSLGTATFITANWAETTAIIPPESAGWLMGLANLGTALAAAAAGLVGPLIDSVGFVPMLVLAATASVGAIAASAVRIPQRRSAASPS
jgi:MFS family permease